MANICRLALTFDNFVSNPQDCKSWQKSGEKVCSKFQLYSQILLYGSNMSLTLQMQTQAKKKWFHLTIAWHSALLMYVLKNNQQYFCNIFEGFWLFNS